MKYLLQSTFLMLPFYGFVLFVGMEGRRRKLWWNWYGFDPLYPAFFHCTDVGYLEYLLTPFTPFLLFFLCFMSVFIMACLMTWVIFLTHWGWHHHQVFQSNQHRFKNGSAPCHCQTISWTIDDYLSFRTSGTVLSQLDIILKFNSFSLKKLHLKLMSSFSHQKSVRPNWQT